MTARVPAPLRIVVLVSGRGSNLQALIDAVHAGQLPAAIRAVISNNAGAPGLARAQRAGIPTHVISHRDFADRDQFDRALMQRIDAYQPQPSDELVKDPATGHWTGFFPGVADGAAADLHHPGARVPPDRVTGSRS